MSRPPMPARANSTPAGPTPALPSRALKPTDVVHQLQQDDLLRPPDEPLPMPTLPPAPSRAASVANPQATTPKTSAHLRSASELPKPTSTPSPSNHTRANSDMRAAAAKTPVSPLKSPFVAPQMPSPNSSPSLPKRSNSLAKTASSKKTTSVTGPSLPKRADSVSAQPKAPPAAAVSQTPSQASPQASQQPAQLTRAGSQQLSWKSLDQRSFSAPEESLTSLVVLIDYLTASLNQPVDKARAIFAWIASHIAFDYETHISNDFSTKLTNMRPDIVFTRRKATSAGYSNLFLTMASMAGLRAWCLNGNTYIPHELEPYGGTNEDSWNAIQIGDQLHFVDCRFASGSLSKELKWRFRFEPFFFLPKPSQFVKTHMPTNPKWQLLDNPVLISEQEFLSFPQAHGAFYTHGLDLIEPKVKTFEAKKTYNFKIAKGTAKSLAVVIQTTIPTKTDLKLVGDYFEGKVAMNFAPQTQVLLATTSINLSKGTLFDPIFITWYITPETQPICKTEPDQVTIERPSVFGLKRDPSPPPDLRFAK